jgi:E3 ubiquitin-protein ligase ZSWIM2
MRIYLVQEKGPTKFVLEESGSRKKFKVEIGSEIKCTCGGGVKEHCVHTIYALSKVFKIKDKDPLIWQISFLDSEIDKILQNRSRYMANFERNQYEEYKAEREAKEEEEKSRPNPLGTATRMKLEKEETCCVCFEEMDESQNLTFCKFQCGRNIHLDCIEAWVRHKHSSGLKITCPLCRTDWGSNALEELKQESRQYRME